MNTSTHEIIKIQPDIQVYFLNYENTNKLIENHWHSSLEVLLVKSGRVNIQIGKTLHQLNKDDSILINSGDFHSTRCLEFSQVQLLQIPPRLLSEKDASLEHAHFAYPQKSAPLYSEFTHLLYELGNIYQKKEAGYALQFSSVLYNFLFLLTKHCHKKISDTEISKNDNNRNRLLLIMNYVKKNHAEPISLSQVSDLVSLCPEYFCRYFKKHMGLSFLSYVNEIRMNYVYADLLNTDNTITQILEKHGFTNYKLFIKIFRQKYHTTPQQFRKQRTSME